MLAIMENFLYGEIRHGDPTVPATQGYHIRPSQQVNMIRYDDQGFELTTAAWQIADPRWSKKKVINSKIENVKWWHEYWDHGRRLIPALGYYEWHQDTEQPMFITVRRNTPVLFFAGFYLTKAGQHQCSILTRKPAHQIGKFHDRMPVILSPDEIQDWLTYTTKPEAAQKTLGVNWEGRFEFNDVKPLTKYSDGPEMIEPYEPPQATLEF